MSPIEIIDYWYSEEMKKHWFSSTPELDNEIRELYESLWESAKAGKLDDWKNTPEGCLALTIVLDQMPLNMFRGQAKSFSTERKAIEVTLFALENGLDQKISNDKLPFLFMPLMHSEKLEDQDLSVKLFEKYDLSTNLRFAKHHRELIKRFGRFPHRNHILGRESSKEESEYLVSKDAFKG
ncbi:MAG: DUF924 family protein [Thiomicrorhabdus sp.]|nr:DUF924 family protein [Thiomicrorhabdus sp.]